MYDAAIMIYIYLYACITSYELMPDHTHKHTREPFILT